MSTPADGLLLFCDFLVHRLHTENLEFLQQIIRDVHAKPPRFETITTLLAVGYPTISILPVANKNPKALAYAQKLLQRIFRGRVAAVDGGAMQNLYVTLRTQLQLTSWQVLLTIYSEFCRGMESAVEGFVQCGFVQCGFGAITILPIAPLAPCVYEDDKKVIKRETEVEVSSYDSDGAVSDASTISPQEGDRTKRIREAVEEIERTAPWKRIFDVSTIVYPFNARSHPALAKALTKFWKKHARAVWERWFWRPFADCTNVPGSEYSDRTLRQQNATRIFVKNVIVPVYEAFGAEFFVRLDAQRSRAYWWWYRESLVELGRMAATVGIDRCLVYIQTQATKRIPTLPVRFSVPTRSDRIFVSASMWSLKVETNSIATSLKKLARAKALNHGVDDSDDE